MDENIQEVRQALAARSQTATLDELRSRGKRAVRVIRPDDVAQMIAAAVNQAMASSGLMAPDEVEGLIERSRAEFQEIVERRRQEAEETERLREQVARLEGGLAAARATAEQAAGRAESADALRDTVEHMQRELDSARSSAEAAREEVDQLEGELSDTKAELQQARDERVQAMVQVRARTEERDGVVGELAAARQRIKELEATLEERAKETPATVGAGINADLVFRMMNEIAELRARTTSAVAAATPAGAADPSAAIAGALAQMTASFTSKLESLGKRMGVSAAVESKGPDLGGLFAHTDDAKLESNLDSVKVTTKTGTGIAANLERLKKLKGGG